MIHRSLGMHGRRVRAWTAPTAQSCDVGPDRQPANRRTGMSAVSLMCSVPRRVNRPARACFGFVWCQKSVRASPRRGAYKLKAASLSEHPSLDACSAALDRRLGKLHSSAASRLRAHRLTELHDSKLRCTQSQQDTAQHSHLQMPAAGCWNGAVLQWFQTFPLQKAAPVDSCCRDDVLCAPNSPMQRYILARIARPRSAPICGVNARRAEGPRG